MVLTYSETHTHTRPSCLVPTHDTLCHTSLTHRPLPSPPLQVASLPPTLLLSCANGLTRRCVCVSTLMRRLIVYGIYVCSSFVCVCVGVLGERDGRMFVGSFCVCMYVCVFVRSSIKTHRHNSSSNITPCIHKYCTLNSHFHRNISVICTYRLRICIIH